SNAPYFGRPSLKTRAKQFEGVSSKDIGENCRRIEAFSD
nr:Chain B, Ulp2p,Topoisomerase 1-associated factor 2 chimera [synthetic construct]